MSLREPIQRRELRRHAESLVRLASTLEQAEDYPTDTAKEFCRLVRKTAQLIADNISTAPEDKLLHIHTLLILLGQNLRYPERSRIDQTPWSMVQATEEFLQAHVGKSCKFIIRPQWNYNYGIIGEFVSVYRSHLVALKDWIEVSDWEAKIGSLSQQRIYCISFPRVERMNVLMHVNWGHEVGHILAGQWLDVHFGDLWKQVAATIETEMRAHLAKLTPPGVQIPQRVIDAQVADLSGKTMTVAQASLKELISDAVGVHLFGPAAFASLAEYSCRLTLDASPLQCKGYPPWRYRLRLVAAETMPAFEAADRASWHAALVSYSDWVLEWKAITEDHSDQAVIDADIITREAYKLITTNWSSIWQQVLEQLPAESKSPYQLNQRQNVVAELVERLECAIPPNETGTWPEVTPAPLADIWNAAWACKVHTLKSVPKSKMFDYLDTLFQLTLKAIEASFVQATFAPHLP